MSDLEILNSIREITGEKNASADEVMSAHTTFRVGGPADYFASPSDADQVAGLIELCRKCEIPYFVLGNGSNLLVSDAGYRGMIINIMDNMNGITVDGDVITAQAGAKLVRVSRLARDNSLTGLEFASGIPGTIGGAVYMNAGAYGGEMKDVVTSVKVMDADGHIYDMSSDELDFSYRHSAVEAEGLIVLEVTMKLAAGVQQDIDDRMKELSDSRRTKQPLEYPSAGSTFKRPEGYFAGKLIMEAGLRGGRIIDGINKERELIGFLKEEADYIIDTTNLLVREFKAELDKIFVQNEEYSNFIITVMSFGFKYGIPRDSDIVQDVRFLPNPYYDLELREKTGNDKEIQDYVMNCKEGPEYLEKFIDLITFLIPNYIKEGKNQLVISIGCTGGKHRSVTIANAVYARLQKSKYTVRIVHRDILKDSIVKKL